MHLDDAGKKPSTTPTGNFHHIVIPLALEMLEQLKSEQYLLFFIIFCTVASKIIVMIFSKSKEVHSHVIDLSKVFKRCKQYKLRMNTFKCDLCVSSGLLGFIVHVKGNDLDSPMPRLSNL